MQFALPPRKASNSTPYTRSSSSPSSWSTRLSYHRRKQLKTAAILGFGILAIFFLLSRLIAYNSGSPSSPAGTPSAVIVTVLDRDQLSADLVKRIVENREDYAARHGYTNFFANTSDYEPYLNFAPLSWSLVPAVRHAMAVHPHSTYFFHLSPHALIMNPTLSLHSHVLNEKRLESLLLKGVPVVPESIIETFSHLDAAADIDLVITQDRDNLSPGSFVLRRGDFARFFLDLWFDPLYRDYSFMNAETHALDHIAQWHPTILARLGLVPQRILNAYNKDTSAASQHDTYEDGDFVIRFFECDNDRTRPCDKDMAPYYDAWARKYRPNGKVLS